MVSISTGRQGGAVKIVIYAQEGWGKSSFASLFPDPLTIDTEGSTKHLDIRRIDQVPKSYPQFLDTLSFVEATRPCKTLIIDTADWLEALMIQDLCAQRGWDGIECKDYGKGYVYLEEMFGKLLNRLEDLVQSGINVVMCAHVVTKAFTSPTESGSWDRYELKLQKKDCAKLKEWADVVLFGRFRDVVMAVDKEGKKLKAKGGEVRVMHTIRTAAWDAKSRFDLSPEIVFEKGILPAEIAGILQGTPAPAVQQPDPIPEPQPVIEEPKAEAPASESAPAEETAKAGDAWRDGVDTRLLQLMDSNFLTEDAIREAVSRKGWFPKETPISKYPQDFVDQMLIAHWQQMVDFIKAQGLDLPF